MVIKPTNTEILSDPLLEAQGNELPIFAKKLNINHFSPTQFTLPDAAWLYKYCVLTQQQRRDLLESNSAMEAGKRVGEALANSYGETIYKIAPGKKTVQPVKHEPIDLSSSIIEQSDLFNDYEPVNDKDADKKIRYIEELPDVINNVNLALKKLAVASPVTCERQISIKNIRSKLFGSFPTSMLPIVGRIDFDFGNLEVSELGNSDGNRRFFPSRIIELKTKWSKLGKVKQDGTRSFILSSLPTTASFGHCVQVAVYSSYFDFKVPASLVYANKKDFKIFDASNCYDLTEEGMIKNLKVMSTVFQRRERILSMFEEQDKEEIIDNAVQLMDPNFDHPFAWNGIPVDMMKHARELWKVA